MNPSPLDKHVSSLPDLINQISGELANKSRSVFDRAWQPTIQRIYLTGCGDSHNAAICTSYYFSRVTDLPCIPLQAMELARYQTGLISKSDPKSALVIGVSASGRVGRTIEALSLAKKAGAITIAVTGDVDSPLAAVSDYVLPAATPSLPSGEQGIVVPGARSFIASMLSLFHSAVSFAETAGSLSLAAARNQREEILNLVDPMRATIRENVVKSKDLAAKLSNNEHFVFCGAGPHLGISMFSAAKMLEASGDSAISYDLEEWAHLEYFSRSQAVTFIISNGGQDQSRAIEVAEAAKSIGRKVVIVSPIAGVLSKTQFKDFHFPVMGEVQEYFSPLISCIPGLLFASARSEAIAEPYFRDFRGGRSRDEGGGISKIQSSYRLEDIPD